MQDSLKNYLMERKGQTPDGFKEADLLKHLVYAKKITLHQLMNSFKLHN